MLFAKVCYGQRELSWLIGSEGGYGDGAADLEESFYRPVSALIAYEAGRVPTRLCLALTRTLENLMWGLNEYGSVTLL